nr:hypothetical protein [Tanacetum cinerariifolium]
MSYLSDFEELNRGYVAFGGNPKGGKITGKGKIKTGIKREFSVPMTPQQNGITERKNRTLIEAARTMLADLLLSFPFGLRQLTLPAMSKIRGGSYSNICAFPIWSVGSTNPQNNDKDALVDGKEHDDDTQKSELAVLHFSNSSTQIRKQVDKTERENKGKSPVESFTGYRGLNAEFEECFNNSNASTSSHDPDMIALEELTYSDNEDAIGAEADINNLESSIPVSPIPTTRIHKDHPLSQIIGDLSSTTQTRSMARAVKDQGGLSQMFNKDFYTCMFACFLSQEEPKRKVWILVDLPYGKRAIGTKWVYRNKKDERGIGIRNKERLIVQGHTQEEGIEYEEVFAPVARIEAIRLFLAYTSFMGFMVYQMDVKSAFIYGSIEEEVYVCQPLGFEDPDHLDKVYKVVKALYGLHQAPRAWFQMSFMGELTIFLGLQVKQKKDGIFISQDKYVAEILRKFRLTEGKSTSTPIDTKKPLLKDPDGEDVDVHTYRSMIGCFLWNMVIEMMVTYILSDDHFITTNGAQLTISNPQERVDLP